MLLHLLTPKVRNNTQVYNAKDTDIVMPMNYLLEYSDH